MNKKLKFSQLAKCGKNNWWRYIIGFTFFFMSSIFAGICQIIIQYIFLKRYNNLSEINIFTTAELYQNNIKIFNSYFQNIPIFLRLLSYLLPWTIIFLTLFFIVKLIHKRNFSSLFTPFSKISYLRFIHGFLIYLWILISVNSVFYFLGLSSQIDITFNHENFFFVLLIVLLFLPFQTLSEDLFVRGYLLQFIGLKIKNSWSLSFITGFIFAFFHLANPEIEAYGLWVILAGYLLPGIFLALVALKDNRMELSLSIHFANNFFTTLILGSNVSSIPSEPFFTYVNVEPFSFADSFLTLAKFGLFYLYFFVINKTNMTKTNKLF